MTTIMKMRERPPKPLIIAQKMKINSKRSKEYMTFLKDFETNPIHYFNSKCNNKPFIIGRTFSQSSFIDFSFSNIRTTKSGFKRKRTAKIIKTYSGGQMKTYITDNELALIYENADNRVNDTETEPKEEKEKEKIISNKPPTQTNYYLKQQENSLKKYESFAKKRTQLSLSISKKIDCHQNTLLMSKQELFRPKKEVLDAISYKGFDIKTQFENCLRQNTAPNIKKNSNDNKKNSAHGIGNISLRERNRQEETMKETIEGKIDQCNPKEIIRNPSYDMLYNNNPLSKNLHLQNKFACGDSFDSAVNKPSLNLIKMSIKGVNLLSFEKSIADKLKGQKILYLEKRKSHSSCISTQTIADRINQFPFLKK